MGALPTPGSSKQCTKQALMWQPATSAYVLPGHCIVVSSCRAPSGAAMLSRITQLINSVLASEVDGAPQLSEQQVVELIGKVGGRGGWLVETEGEGRCEIGVCWGEEGGRLGGLNQGMWWW